MSHPFQVYFTQTASAVVNVEADDYDAAIDVGYDGLPGSLCHQCAHEVELAGDWEPSVVFDGDGKVAWEDKR